MKHLMVWGLIMRLPDGTVLMHAGLPYDSAKAHAYYLNYRKLHPRQPGAAKTSVSYTVQTGKGSTVKVGSQQLAEQKVYADLRVSQIKTKLTTLTAELNKRLQKAKAGPTVADKSKAARDSKQYRDTHKQEIANKSKTAAASKPPAKTETTASLKTHIVNVKADLKAAVAKQRELATAKKNG
jgi:hypothetical protein